MSGVEPIGVSPIGVVPEEEESGETVGTNTLVARGPAYSPGGTASRPPTEKAFHYDQEA